MKRRKKKHQPTNERTKTRHTIQNKTNSSARHVIIYGLQCIEQRTVDSIKLCSESNGRVSVYELLSRLITTIIQ